MTPSGNEPVTFRLVAHSLNQLRRRVLLTFYISFLQLTNSALSSIAKQSTGSSDKALPLTFASK